MPYVLYTTLVEVKLMHGQNCLSTVGFVTLIYMSL